eukprot:CAMPEP_0178385220 /NCGR_PEP_ID=MMETSP0689_2-20121128/7922_1 /TAXON_ID=160604 /ORGANISM="Amphidinium massartii, Strain CS-259" /LENGTH=192 /DNA_ID=CAMNT_0020005499 /DNA_START=47 /DNA_END=622 /DNA_ORIENTATION=+
MSPDVPHNHSNVPHDAACSDVQQIVVLLGASLILLLFAPKGFLLGVLVLFILYIHVSLTNHGDETKKLGKEGSSLHVEADDEDADGTDYGPSLVLVFDADYYLDPDAVEQPPSPRRLKAGHLTLPSMLQRLADAGQARLLTQGHFIYCVVRVPEDTARASLLVYARDLQLDPGAAHSYAKANGMLLARLCRP